MVAGDTPAAGMIESLQFLQRTAGNSAVEALLARHTVQRDGPATATATPTATPTQAPGSIQDPSKLSIVKPPAEIDYYEFVRTGHALEIYSSWAGPSPTQNWELLDAVKSRVAIARKPGAFYIFPHVLRRHLEDRGPTAFGVWTLHCEKEQYYDDAFIKVVPGPGPSTPLEGQTTTSLHHIRSVAGGGHVLADLTGMSIPVKVTDKAELRTGDKDSVWFQIILKAPVSSPAGKMAAGDSGWVSADSVIAKVTWPFFLAQVAKFEADNKTLSLDERITKLRQWSHEKKLDFDSVIGTKHGSEYLDTRGFVKDRWEILKDSQTVTTPSGEDVNVYHLMVGLDVLTKRVEKQTDWGFAIGQNYAAATWSGDLGSAAADASLGQDKDWEKAFISPKMSASDKLAARIIHYYETRAPEAEMLGDLDAWGMTDERSSTKGLDSIKKMLASYYGRGSARGGAPKRPTAKRKGSIELFLKNYGFNTKTALKSQAGPRAAMQEQVVLFAKEWRRNRAFLIPDAGSDVEIALMIGYYVEPMLDRYLDWLDGLVTTYGAVIAP